MSSLKKYNLQGEAVGDVSVNEAFLSSGAHSQSVKDYIVALRANKRQWSANTKGRTEINHSNKKPWRQKGTGNARQGTFAAPQFKGGGVVFGPKPKFNQHVRINQKEKRLAIRHLLAQKIKKEEVLVLEESVLNSALLKPQTKAVVAFLKKHNLYGRRVLFVVGSGDEKGKCDPLKKSMRNLPKSDFAFAPNVNGYDVMAARQIVVTESALSELISL